MDEELLVSIALCAYNGEKYISQQLDSILRQTHRNLEIIIVDDCSTDNTFNIVKRYSVLDSRIKCFRNEVNIGFNKNFEKAIKLTTGDFIAISDQDDIWLPGKVELLLNNIGDNWLIFSNSSFIDENNKVKAGRMLWKGFDLADRNYRRILLANFITGHNLLFKREFAGYFLPLPKHGFYDWWIGFVALYHKKITFLDKTTTQYRIHGHSVMQQRIISGQEEQEKAKTIDHMLTAFASYERLEKRDKVFITQLKDAYKKNIFYKNAIPLIKVIVNNYRELFTNEKIRKGLSLFNFALKYAWKVRKYV